MPRRSRPSKRVGLPGLLIFMLAAAAGAAALYLVAGRLAGPPAEAPEAAAAPAPPAHESVQPRATDPPATPETGPRPAAERRGAAPKAPAAPAEPLPAGPGTRVAVVIDDLGRDVGDVQRLDRLGVPVTYAVLPFETRTPAVVEAIRRHGHEMILHLPMEARGAANPGPGALLAGMDAGELEHGTLEALAAVPDAVGVNNHMGSLLSADEAAMRTVLSVLSRRDLYFLDSRTSADSVGFRLAVSLGVPAAERQVFLDPDPSEAAVTAQFRQLLELARQRGSAIAIGHPYPSTLAVLAREIPRARELGYEFVPVSFLVERSTAPAR